ncbi:hypothetical protein SAMN06297358_1455 [Pedobacter xixiisoli]|uniref:Uncharacterized protein n=1 Tax=Pedobacter xixiisoli TaxID=1476464 RepID=A0A285ZX19_9SPHI|nr:hypothetical protein SAMN06297358_1455 [Pedobacter xixiisoli]
MKSIGLNNNLIFSIEPLVNSVRLIVSEVDHEIACRKETIKNLNSFLEGDNENIFKGRLQLSKLDQDIEIIINKIPIGKIPLYSFSKLLNEA